MKFDFIFFLLLAMVFILFALWYCTHQILGAIRDLQNAQIGSEIETRTIIWRLRTAIINSHGRGLEDRLRMEADSRL